MIVAFGGLIQLRRWSDVMKVVSAFRRSVLDTNEVQLFEAFLERQIKKVEEDNVASECLPILFASLNIYFFLRHHPAPRF